MSEKLVLIDGHSILHRAFYGVPDLTNFEGVHTNAVYGFLNIMFKVLEEESPDYLIVAFDVNAPTFRHKMFAEYKGTRKPMLPELREQVPLIKEILEKMNITIAEQAGYEADDVIGTLAKTGERDGLEVSVISGDRDLLQLATDRIKIRIPKTKAGRTEVEDYLASDVKERYHVSPIEFIDVKALMGDSSDNIPGVPGVGEKTATKIIVEYGNIENAYEHADEIKPPRAQNALKDHYNLALMSKELATININSPVPCKISDGKIGEMYTKEAFQIMKRLEFKSFLTRFEHKTEENNSCESEFAYISDLAAAERVFTQASEYQRIGINIIGDSEMLGLSLTYGMKQIYYIDISGLITEEYLIERLNQLINKVEKTALIDLKHHLKYIKLDDRSKAFDCEIAGYLLNPLKDSYDYEDIARDYLNMPVPSRTELIGKELLQSAKLVLEDKFIKYACYSSCIVYAALESLTDKLVSENMLELFHTIEMPLVYALYDMEQVGIKVEKEALKEYGDKLAAKIDVLQKEIHQEVGSEFNINSPKQLGEILFVKLGLPGGKKTKTGYSTSAGVLEKLAPEYPVVNKILEYRQYTKLKSTYADGLANYIGDDNRIHGKFNQTITATGRISSTEPNLQNIPIRMELGREIRKVFVPERDYVFIDADYSQIELRVLAHISGDRNLIDAYKMDQDIHKITAANVFNTPLDKVTNAQRSNAKAVNFGIVYGISSFGLSQDLSISRKEAAGYIEQYFKTYPRIKEFLDETVEFAKENGFVTTMFQRKRPIPELKSSNFMQRSFGERIAMNSPIQGTAADIIKIAMIQINQEFKSRKLKSKIVLQVHDELLIEAYHDEVQEVKEILYDKMPKAADLSVPLEIGLEMGNNWYEAH